MGLKTSKLLPKHIEQLSKQTGFVRYRKIVKIKKNPVKFQHKNFIFRLKSDHEEIEKWHRGFVRDCPTGKLQKSEFVQIYRELFPNGNATTFSEFIFNVFDAGKKTLLNFAELQLSSCKTVLQMRAERLSLKSFSMLCQLLRSRVLIKRWVHFRYIGSETWCKFHSAQLGIQALRYQQRRFYNKTRNGSSVGFFIQHCKFNDSLVHQKTNINLVSVS